MKPTHVTNLGPAAPVYTVTAWQYRKTSPIPSWVASNFHDLQDGSGTLRHRSGHVVNEDDWILTTEQGLTVLADPEFQQWFKNLP
jgi:hypothetical protein